MALFIARSRPLVARAGCLARPALLAPRPSRMKMLTVRNFASNEAEPERAEETQVAKSPEQNAPMTRSSPSVHRLSSMFKEMQQEMDALTRGFWGADLFNLEPFTSPLFRSELPAMRTELPAMRLATDIIEDEQGFTIKADVPGMSKEDVKLQLRNDVLLITGERKQESKGEEQGSHWVERSFGSFARRFKLPGHVDAEGITAKCEDGVLTVKIPKKEQPKPEVQEIPVV